MGAYFKQRMSEIREEMSKAALHAPAPKAEKPYERRGYVYFFRAGNAVKIGFSINPRARAKTLQTASAERAFMAKLVEGPPRREREFHKRFAEYRIGGEWFDLRGRLAEYLEQHVEPVEFPEPAPFYDDDFRL